MCFNLKNILLFTAVLTLFFLESGMAASGGFRVFASDAEIMGKGSAFTGEADNPAAIVYNPAGLTQLKGENHLSIGAAVIQPLTEHTSTSGVNTQARIDTFVIPHVFFVSDFGLDRFVFGIGSTSNFGLGTDWASNSFSGYSATRTSIENMDSYVTVAYEIDERFSIGIGTIVTSSKINKEKQILQLGGGNGNGQIKGDDYGFGFTVSGLAKLNDQHQIGVIYRSAIDLTYEGDITANGLRDSGAGQYSTIFGGSSYKTTFKSNLTLPQSAVLGYSYTPNDYWRFNFDAEWMDWSSIRSEHLTFPEETNGSRLAVLEALTKADRDWMSTVSFSVGTEYSWNESLRLRGGYYYAPTPIPDANFDSSIPTNDAHGFNLGFGYDLRIDLTLDMAWTGLLYEDKKVNNTFGNAVGANLDGTYKSFVNIAVATLNYTF